MRKDNYCNSYQKLGAIQLCIRTVKTSLPLTGLVLIILHYRTFSSRYLLAALNNQQIETAFYSVVLKATQLPPFTVNCPIFTSLGTIFYLSDKYQFLNGIIIH